MKIVNLEEVLHPDAAPPTYKSTCQKRLDICREKDPKFETLEDYTHYFKVQSYVKLSCHSSY